jgi:hypothetical protein
MVMTALGNMAARSEFICLCAEQEAEEEIYGDRSPHRHDLLVQAGVREAFAMLTLEEEWQRRKLR